MYYFNIIVEIIKNYEEYGEYYGVLIERFRKNYIRLLLDKNIMIKYKIHGALILLNKNLYKRYMEIRVKNN